MSVEDGEKLVDVTPLDAHTVGVHVPD